VLSSARDITERQRAGDALRESEERYRSLYENVPIGIYRTSPDGHILLANPTLVRMLGFTTFEELSQRNLATGSYEPDYPRQEFKDRIERDGEVHGFESAWKCKDGSYIYVRESARLVQDKSTLSSYYEGIVEDISEKKKTEEALRKSELSLQSVLQSTADGILAVGSENEILFVSERFAELWQIPPLVMSSKDDSILLRHALDQLSDPQSFLKKVQELYKSKEESFDTLTFKDGRVFERLSRPLMQGAEVVGRVWSFRNITESKRIEEKLEKERILLRTLIDNIPDRVYAMDTSGRKILSNLADLHASGGKTLEDVIGKTDLEIYPLELAKKYWSANMEVIENGISIINQEEPGFDSQGNPLWVLTSKVPLRDVQGNIAGLVGVGRDITDRKKADELQDATYRIAQAADKAENLDSLYCSIHAIIRQVMNADNFYFALYDEKNDLLSFPYFIDPYDVRPSEPTPNEGLTGYVIRSQRSLLVTSAMIDQLVQQGELELIGRKGEDWLGVPLKIEDRIIGVMATQSYVPEFHYKQKDMELLEFVSTQVAQAIERKRLEEEVRSLSLTDDLTGLYNRRGFTLLAEREVIVAHRMNRPMLLFFCDVDNFKLINDTWGHAQGDLALKEISNILKENFRESDILARIGGDEFVILAVDSSQESAETMANRIQTFFSIRNQQGDKPYKLSLSLGVTRFNPENPCSVSELIVNADGLMYQQKQAKKKLDQDSVIMQ
jgi:diguanylate cyclase (GGDEF)-like protein/PAS domain S-box-containing protein